MQYGADKVLELLDFGQDVAEHETRLSEYFVSTPAFTDLVRDETDLIIGSKGSGKTALFRHLIDPAAVIPGLEDVDVLPAFNVRGAVIFRMMLAEAPAHPHLIQLAWVKYILALTVAHLSATYGHSDDVQTVIALAKNSGIPTEGDARNLFGGTLHRLRDALKRATVRGDIGGEALPASLGFEVEFGSTSPTLDRDIDELVFAVTRALETLGRRVWVLFDRLDEAFFNEPTFEQIALRSLLLAHNELASYGPSLRTKLFLRSDVLDRATRDGGITNATHIRRRDLTWTREEMFALVQRRVEHSSAASHAYLRANPASALGRTAPPRRAGFSVLPARVENLDTWHWMLSRTTDATGALSPRNLLGLLRLAQRSQMSAAAQPRRSLRDRPQILIETPSLHEASRELSRARVQDTVYAEFNHLRSYVDALKGLSFQYTEPELAELWAVSDPEALARIVAELEYAGVIGRTPEGELVVPLLFRPALALRHRHLDDAYILPLAKPTRVYLDDVARLVGQHVVQMSEPYLVSPLPGPIRAYLHRQMQDRYGLFTESIGPAGSFRRIMVANSPVDGLDWIDWLPSEASEAEWELTRRELAQAFADGLPTIEVGPLAQPELDVIDAWSARELGAPVDSLRIPRSRAPYIRLTVSDPPIRRRRERGRRSTRGAGLKIKSPSARPVTLARFVSNPTDYRELDPVDAVEQLLRDMLGQKEVLESLERHGVSLAKIGNWVHRVSPGFNVTMSGFHKFVDLVAAAIVEVEDDRGTLEIQLDQDSLPRVYFVPRR
jgi:hypothetical protein